jgi:hypothetical protein
VRRSSRCWSRSGSAFAEEKHAGLIRAAACDLDQARAALNERLADLLAA